MDSGIYFFTGIYFFKSAESLFWADHPHIMREKPGIRNRSVVRH